MKNEILLICGTTVVIMGMYMFQNRYEFFINNQRIMAIGDNWTGCVDYSTLATRSDLLSIQGDLSSAISGASDEDINPFEKYQSQQFLFATLNEIRQKYPQYNDINDTELAQRIHQKYFAGMPFDKFNEKFQQPIIQLGKMIRSQCWYK